MKVVGVLTPTKELYRAWIDSETALRFGNARFVFVNDIDCLLGVVFTHMVLGPRHDDVPCSVREALEMRLRQKEADTTGPDVANPPSRKKVFLWVSSRKFMRFTNVSSQPGEPKLKVKNRKHRKRETMRNNGKQWLFLCNYLKTIGFIPIETIETIILIKKYIIKYSSI